MNGARSVLAVLLLAVAVRLPFWREALRTPPDGDLAITGLMAAHPFSSLTMWGQPYGSPLDAWLTLPALRVLGSTTLALRLPGFLFGLLLVPLAFALARQVDARAALPAAALAALAPPYLLLMASAPPPFYATTLVLCAAVLLLAHDSAVELDAGRPARSRLLALGALGGLAAWTHLMSLSALGAAAWRLRRHGRRVILALVALLLWASPLLWRTLHEPGSATPLATSDRDESLGQHLAETLPVLHQPLGALLGTHAPLLADAPAPIVSPPAAVAGLIVAGWLVSLLLAWRARSLEPTAAPVAVTAATTTTMAGRESLRMLALAAVLTLAAFPFPLRSGPHSVRFLTPVFVPLVVLGAVGLARALSARGRLVPLAAAAALGLLQAPGAVALASAWRAADRTAEPFSLPDLKPVIAFLESKGLRHAYASYGPASRLGFESEQRIVASQPWNERFRHHPLPLLDDVRFAKDVAWVLTPGVPTDLPSPRGFEDALGQLRAQCRREEMGAAVVFWGCDPGYGPSVSHEASWGPVGDGDAATETTCTGAEPIEWRLPVERALDAVTLVAPLVGPRLPRGFDLLVGDGTRFEKVARRRRREERLDLRFVNGHPQYVVDHDLYAVPLGGRRVKTIRLEPQPGETEWGVSELLLHDAVPPEARRPWDEWLDPRLSWAERNLVLLSSPKRDREDWYSRLLLASRGRDGKSP